MRAPWPRKLPLGFIWMLFFNHPLRIFGWTFLLIGGSLTHVFLMLADLDTSEFGTREDQGWYLTVGQIIDREFTSTSINGQSVKRYEISFHDGQGREVSFHGYTLDVYETLENIDVEYHLESSLTPRARGMRRAPFGVMVLILLVFPIVGGLCSLWGIWPRLRLMRVLTHGELTEGRFETREVIKDPDEGTLYLYRLTYLDQRGADASLEVNYPGPSTAEKLNAAPARDRSERPPGLLEDRVLFLHPRPSSEVTWLPQQELFQASTLWWDGERFRFKSPDYHLYSIIVPLVTIGINLVIHRALG